MKSKILNKKRERRVSRNRARIFGTSSKPRLSVSRSNRFIYAQLIDDEKMNTLVHASSRDISKSKSTKSDSARLVGETLAKNAVDAVIKWAFFDWRYYKYHGRIKALADGARKGGLKL